MSTSTLPVVSLAYPLLLLPTARFTIPVNSVTGELLFQLVQESETQPVVAAVPIPSADATIMHEWGCAARIVRLVKPPRAVGRDQQRPYLLTLHGLSRIHLPQAREVPEGLDELIELVVEYPRQEGDPSAEAFMTFKGAALKLLDRLSSDAVSEAKRDFYSKLTNMVDEAPIKRAGWIADVLVASLNAEYADKLGECCYHGLSGNLD